MNRIASVSVACAALFISASVFASVELNPLFTDHLVLQRDVACPIWGKVKPNAKVQITLDGKVMGNGVADAEGNFRIRLPKLEASLTPRTLQVSSDGETAALTDVVVGDVWLCSGQSNMQWALASARDGAVEVAQATNPQLRLFQVERIASPKTLDTVKGRWQASSPESAGEFSAVAYFFGRKLQSELNVPIGLIHSSWGGTPAEAWTPLPTLETLTGLQEVTRQVRARELGDSPEARRKYEAAFYDYLKATGRLDEGPSDAFAGWAKPEVLTDDWKPQTVPGDWTRQGIPNGTAWFRRSIDVPEALAGKDLTLAIGRIDDHGTTFFNGERVGQTSWKDPEPWSVERRYTVPGALVKAGRNVIAVRVVDTGGAAGMAGPADAMKATIGDRAWPLAGEWLMKVERDFVPGDGANIPAPVPPMRADSPNAPASLYNGMIHPLGDFGIKGAIWYQGESNAGRFSEYEALMTALINSWRKQFGVGEFPFYIVGLANFTQATDDANKPSNWAGLREAQRQLDRNVKNVATTVTIDIGEANDIHPRNKQDVGLRLALVALDETYGKSLVSRGPTFDRADFDGGKVTVHFKNVGGGLKSVEAPARSFAIAGKDGVFAWADVRIDGDAVVLSSPGVPEPVRVRYAWAENPSASLFNVEGLPAEPFESHQ